jgi:uncharacterized protein YkwD
VRRVPRTPDKWHVSAHLHNKRVPLAAVFAALAILLVSPTLAEARNYCKRADAQPNRISHRVVVRATLCLLNKERAQRGLGKLRLSRKLGRAARHHSADMARRGYFSHDSRSGESFLDRIRRAGYLRRARQWYVGENIAWGTGALATPRSIVRAWMNSPGHRANILNGRFHHIGVGISYNAPRRVSGRAAATYTTDFGMRR